MHPVAVASFADRLAELVLEIDPARRKWEAFRERAHQRSLQLKEELDQLVRDLQARRAASAEARTERMEAFERKVQELLETARANIHQLSEATASARESHRWRALYAALAQNYEALTRELKSQEVRARFQKLAPANWSRTSFHILSGLGGALLYQFVLTRGQAIAIMATLVVVFTSLEIGRRYSPAFNDFLMRLPFLRAIARAHEYYKVNSATYYAYGMLAITILCPSLAVACACLVLAFGDPAASTVGRRYGKTKLYKTKSLAGFGAFVVVASLVVFGFLRLAVPSVGLGGAIAAAGIAGLTGGVVELVSDRIDDNFTIPVSVAFALSLFAF